MSFRTLLYQAIEMVEKNIQAHLNWRWKKRIRCDCWFTQLWHFIRYIWKMLTDNISYNLLLILFCNVFIINWQQMMRLVAFSHELYLRRISKYFHHIICIWSFHITYHLIIFRLNPILIKLIIDIYHLSILITFRFCIWSRCIRSSCRYSIEYSLSYIFYWFILLYIIVLN